MLMKPPPCFTLPLSGCRLHLHPPPRHSARNSVSGRSHKTQPRVMLPPPPFIWLHCRLSPPPPPTPPPRQESSHHHSTSSSSMINPLTLQLFSSYLLSAWFFFASFFLLQTHKNFSTMAVLGILDSRKKIWLYRAEPMNHGYSCIITGNSGQNFYLWDIWAWNSYPDDPRPCALHDSCLTYGRQLRHAADIGTLQELGLAVVNVLHLDDKLWLWFQGIVG